jgi:phytoene synthase
MIAGREAEAEPAIPDRAAWIAYLRATGGALAVAAGRALGGEGAVLERLATLGAAYAVAGQLRNVRALARQGRCLLPEDFLGAHGLTVHDAIANPDDARLGPVFAAAAAIGRGWLAEAGGRVPRPLLAAALPAALARRDLRRPAAAAANRGLGDRLAVLRAAIMGRV